MTTLPQVVTNVDQLTINCGTVVRRGGHPAIFQGHEKPKLESLRLVETPRFPGVLCSTRLCRKRSQDRQHLLAERLARNHYGNINLDVVRRPARGLAGIFDRDTGRRLEGPAPLS